MSPARRDLAGYLSGLGAGAAGLLLFGFVDLWLGTYLLSNDFSGIWAGPRALVLGGDPYDAATWPATATALQGQRPQTAVYGYPGYVAIALVPLALLPLPVAAIAWTAGGLILASVALGLLLRRTAPGLPPVHGLFGATLLLSQPGFTSFYDGQWSFLLVAATAGLVLAIRRRAGIASGALAAVLLAKPHLFLVALLPLARAAAVRGATAAPAVTAAIGLGLLAVSVAVLPGWPAAFVAHAGAPRLGSARVTTLPVAAGDLAGPLGGVLALVAIALAVVAASRFSATRDAHLAAWLAVSLLAAPYAWSYDQLVLIVPLAIAAGVASRRRRALGLAAASAGCALLLVGGLLLHGLAAHERQNESLNALIGAAVVAIVLVAAWPERRAHLVSRH